jgi:hypothetical protein
MDHTRDAQIALATAGEMVDTFEDYLLGDDLYQQLKVSTPAGDRMPNMSAGSLLATLQNLQHAQQANQLSAEEAQRLAELDDEFHRLARRYPDAYREKLARELKSQLDSWRWFLQDCHEDPPRCRDDYPFEVRARNRAALLLDELGEQAPADQRTRLNELDRDLRGMFAAGPFVLDEELRDRHPRDRYWWLYGRPAP